MPIPRKKAKLGIAIGALLAVAAIVLIVALRPGQKAQPASEPYGLEAMAGFERLPYLKTGVFAGGASSYDRTEGNSDGFGASNYLYVDERGDNVMLDLKGPGTLYRMWFTGFNPVDAYVKIYFDGEAAPRIDMPLRDLFAGTNAPFLAPLVADDNASSGGFVSYVPLTFAKSVKITTNGSGDSFFYNVGYHRYGSDANVTTWNGKEDSAAVRAMWKNAGTDPKSGSDNASVSVTDTIGLAGGQTASLLQVDGPRSISSIKLKIPGAEPGSDAAMKPLNDLWMRIYWDGESKPSVDAPVGSLFAMGQFGAYGTKTVPVGMDESGTMYMYFPMPFEKEAKVELVNTGSDAVFGIFYEIKHNRFRDAFDNVGYFKTRFTERKAEASDGKDLVILDEEGAGHFVGVVQSLKSKLNQGPVDRWHLEGDEKIFVDDSRSPVIHGTGTEDFYNAGWYFNHGLFTTPTAGYTAFRIENEVDSTSMYRLFVHDVVPFRKHIRAVIEHGALNDVTEDVAMLAYYYHQPRSRAVLSDTLDIGNAESEKSHSYKIDGQTWSGSSVYQYEGMSGGELIEDDGRAHDGYSEFTLAIEPGNEGVILRRRFDQTVENQSADIYVGDKLVGTWYMAGSNGMYNWRDDDFIIPGSFTEGKKEIRIKAEFAPTAQAWNEYLYTAYSLLP